MVDVQVLTSMDSSLVIGWADAVFVNDIIIRVFA